MERPIPETSTLLITDSSVPGKYALLTHIWVNHRGHFNCSAVEGQALAWKLGLADHQLPVPGE